METSPILKGSRSIVFRAAATTLIAPGSPIDASDWLDIEAIVEHALAQRPARMRRQFALFLGVVQNAPVLMHGRWFTALDPERRTRFLTRLERSPIQLLRRGLWGLRTLAFMGWYGRASVAAQIGYRASPAGWDALEADASSS